MPVSFSVAIPTYNRPDNLLSCVRAVIRSTRLPVEVICIDDGDLPEASIRAYQDMCGVAGVQWVYYKKNHALPEEQRGSSVSKNFAMRIATQPIVVLLDDDVEVDVDFCAAIMSQWDKNQNASLVGVGGIIRNNRVKSFLESLYHALFGLKTTLPWDVSAVGYQSWDDQVSTPSKVHFVHIGASAIDRVKAQSVGFPFFGGGRAALEDVAFCLKAKTRGFHFIIEPKAQVVHLHSPASREAEVVSGYKESLNRRAIFREFAPKTIRHTLWFVWASVGWILRQVLGGHLRKAWGMVLGFFVRPSGE